MTACRRAFHAPMRTALACTDADASWPADIAALGSNIAEIHRADALVVDPVNVRPCPSEQCPFEWLLSRTASPLGWAWCGHDLPWWCR